MNVARDDRRLLELTFELKNRTRRSRDWISTAEKARALLAHDGSKDELASRLGISRELLRALLSLTELPSQVQSLVREGKILFDAAQRLHTIKDPGLQIRVAIAIQGLPSLAQREAIKFATRNPERELSAFLKRLSAQDRNEVSLRFVLVSFSTEEFRAISAYGRRAGISVNEVVRRSALTASGRS